MCICQTPDNRSDYSLLRVTRSFESHANANANVNANVELGARNREDVNHNAYLASQGYTNSLHDNSEYDNTIWSKWEIRLRFVMVICLIFTSIALYQKQQEVEIQREKINSSMKELGRIQRRLGERNITKQNSIYRRRSLDEEYRLATFGINFDTSVDGLETDL